ncbi:Eukaryotic RNA Recognition Motif [Carpediemonas membranifera]|uniref:Eukaryotic RNA Recognition Motif n=1 Tax=Carpediemonas membranifera TaxID=201153 RepID=A0A8J6B1K3_9EUKA|nr:Eukaryotic RNA Recognition Motif [Carpediemonas membranifera]|eukprot:KAG9393723.1 Eukaryotic RNA Recognition Motif [Carpediemonas membranifera]
MAAQDDEIKQLAEEAGLDIPSDFEEAEKEFVDAEEVVEENDAKLSRRKAAAKKDAAKHKYDFEAKNKDTLFIGGVPAGVSSSKMKRVVKKFAGTLEPLKDAKILTVRFRSVALKRAALSSQSKRQLIEQKATRDTFQNAYVVFDNITDEARQQLVELAATESFTIMDFPVTIDIASEKTHEEFDSHECFFIGNIPRKVSPLELMESIAEGLAEMPSRPDIQHIRIVRDKATGDAQTAFVSVGDRESRDKINDFMKYKKHTLGGKPQFVCRGRPLRVIPATNREKLRKRNQRAANDVEKKEAHRAKATAGKGDKAKRGRDGRPKAKTERKVGSFGVSHK